MHMTKTYTSVQPLARKKWNTRLFHIFCLDISYVFLLVDVTFGTNTNSKTNRNTHSSYLHVSEGSIKHHKKISHFCVHTSIAFSLDTKGNASGFSSFLSAIRTNVQMVFLIFPAFKWGPFKQKRCHLQPFSSRNEPIHWGTVQRNFSMYAVFFTNVQDYRNTALWIHHIIVLRVILMFVSKYLKGRCTVFLSILQNSLFRAKKGPSHYKPDWSLQWYNP